MSEREFCSRMMEDPTRAHDPVNCPECRLMACAREARNLLREVEAYKEALGVLSEALKRFRRSVQADAP